MCHLSVPWQPPSIPQKYPKVVFDGFCMLLAKCCKQIGKPGRPKVLNLLSRPMWKRWFWRATLHFFGIDVPGCAILVFRSSLPKHIWPPKKPFHPLLVPMWNSRFWGSAVHFFALERVEKNQPPSNHPNVVHVLAPPMWKKVVLAAVFIFLGQDVPGCAILLFPGNPPAIPQKYPKVVFDYFCMVLQNVAKRSENQAAQKCSISYCVLCEKGGFEALRFIFSESTCLGVPT
jgi:hypothetical protein